MPVIPRGRKSTYSSTPQALGSERKTYFSASGGTRGEGRACPGHEHSPHAQPRWAPFPSLGPISRPSPQLCQGQHGPASSVLAALACSVASNTMPTHAGETLKGEGPRGGEGLFQKANALGRRRQALG